VLSCLSKRILKMLGWTVRADLPDIGKYVVIVAPHTSNWDFLLGILTAKALNMKVNWMGKHSIFRWPYGWFFRAIGGTAIHRDGGKNYLQQMADLFNRSERMILALAPEGTRSKTDHWKTGFHYIARAANVPILMAYIDYGKKQVGISNMLYPGDDIEADFDKIRQFYKNFHGKNPQNTSLIRIRTKQDPPNKIDGS
jgi:1-acyl-sn-glycerol-3-phosphate acyltransferase